MNNNQAIGYFKLTALALGVDEEQIEIMADEMEHQMDIKSTDEALDAFHNS